MWASPAPIERLPGRSQAGYFAGFIGGLLAVWIVWGSIQYETVSTFGGVWNARDYLISADLQNLGVVLIVLFATLWFLVVPVPLGPTELSPWGIRVQYGIRNLWFPRAQVFVAGSKLYTVSGWLGLASRWSLTPDQVARIRVVLALNP